MGLFVIFNVGCAVGSNLVMLLVMRFLSGFFGSPVVTNSGGCLADVWLQEERSVPFALFTMGSSVGPVLGPIAGGFIAQYLKWRWVYWIVSIYLSIEGVVVVYVVCVWLMTECSQVHTY